MTSFQLAVIGRTDFGSVKARLISSDLDAGAYEDGSMNILVESRIDSDSDIKLLLESFQLMSLLEYLKVERDLRAIAEKTLMEARCNWLNVLPSPASEIWADTHFDYLWLPCIKHNIADGGNVNTQSMYIVVYKVQWDQEHVRRTLKYRDGRLVSFGIDGD